MRSFLHSLRLSSPILVAFVAPTLGVQSTPPATQAGAGQKDAPIQSQSILRATTRLVVLDIVALNDKGEPVHDLKAEDFTVLEDGKPQKISHFSLHQPPAGGAATAAPKLAPNVISNAPAFSNNSCLNVILLDAINTDFSSHAYAQDMLVKYLESSPTIQPTAVFAMAGKLTMLHDFTTDTKVLRDVVAQFKFEGPTHIPDVYAAASPFQRRGSYQAGPNARGITARSMLFLAHALGGYPGRKNLIWLSEGFPINLFPEVTLGDGVAVIEDFSPLAERIADELMNAQVALYPIDAAGVSINDRFPARTAMESMAERTGGKTFFNRNDIDTGIRTSIDDGSSYYTLEYYPENKKWDGKFRRIELKLARPQVSLRSRQGYFALAPESMLGRNDEAERESFSRALDRDAPNSSAVRFQAGVVPPSAQTQNKVIVNFGIDPHTLAFERQNDDLRHAMVSCVVWAYPAKGDPVRAEGESNAALKTEVYQQMMSSYFPCQRSLTLKRGTYTLRLGVLDETTSLIGTTTTQLNVP